MKLTATFTENHNPGNKQHLRSILKNYLEGKGVKTKQEYVDGYPQHRVVLTIE